MRRHRPVKPPRGSLKTSTQIKTICMWNKQKQKYSNKCKNWVNENICGLSAAFCSDDIEQQSNALMDLHIILV